MKFAFLFLVVICLGFVSASVDEYNYFKYGTTDVSGYLNEGTGAISGAYVKGFVCSDSACSGSLGDLWGSLYSASSGINLVYPTVLRSSSGYGYWVYKTGYIPYYVRGTTYWGTGTAPARNVYLSKKTDCISELSLKGVSYSGSEVSFDAVAESPMLSLWGSMYVPSGVADYLDSAVTVTTVIEDGVGNVVWTKSVKEIVDYAGSVSVPFSTSLVDGSYTVVVTTSSSGEAQCLKSTPRSESFSFTVDTCVQSLVDGPWSSWSDMETCQADDFLTQERSSVRSDENSCGDWTDVTSWDYQEVSCDYCTPLAVNASWSDWLKIESCQADDFLTEERSLVDYDSNNCYAVTGLADDKFESVTYTESREDPCDYCTPSIVSTSWSSWDDVESCQADDFLTQSRFRLEYDENSCGESEDIKYWDYKEVSCDYCTLLIVNTSWSSWLDTEVCQADDFLTEERSLIEYDKNDCYAVTGLTDDKFVNVTHVENQEKSCDYCTPSIVDGPWSSWADAESCQTNDFLTQERFSVRYDENNCGDWTDVTSWDYKEVSCDYCTPSRVNESWGDWEYVEDCGVDDLRDKERSLIEYDENGCYALTGLASDASEDVIFWDFGEGSCDYCTPSIVNTSWSSWVDSGSCSVDYVQLQNRSLLEYDENGCYDLTGLVSDEFVDFIFWDWRDVSCDSIPVVVEVIADPAYGVVPLDVSFSCVAEGGDGVLEYFWDLGNGDKREGFSFVYTYDEIGEFDVECGVRDENGDEAFGNVDVEVVAGSLDIVELICFEEVVVGHNQSCSVYVEDGNGDAVGGIDVEIFYSDGSSFGECVSDGISGACGVKDLQSEVGEFEVYVVASGDKYLSDDDGEPRFVYEVLEEEYLIVDLKVFNDSAFSREDYDFFRGEDLFVSFSVEGLIPRDGGVDFDNLISEVSLVSAVAGGRVELEEVEIVGSVYYYRLIPVPITHDFIGDSNVFAFVFDFVEGNGGQAEVSLIIRNNLPEVSPGIPEKEVTEDKSISFDLEEFENDVEDSGDDLSWEIVSFGNGVDVSLEGKVLNIEGLEVGEFEVVLRLVDLDLDYDEVVFGVDVVAEEKRRSSGGSSCSNNWECSLWSGCEDGVDSRTCVDMSDCSRERDRPEEIRVCFEESSLIYLSDAYVSYLEEESSVEKNSLGSLEVGEWIYWVLGVLILLILLVFVLIVFRI